MDKQPNKRQISFDEVQKYSRDKGCLCMEGSALSGKNVNEMFESVIRKYAENSNEIVGGQSNKKAAKESVKLDAKKGQKKKSSCC